MLDTQDLRSVISIGTFRERTRAAAASLEAMRLLALVGLEDAVEQLLPGPQVVKVVRVKLRSPEDAERAIRIVRSRPIASEKTVSGQMWINRARTPADIARTGPVGRAVRTLKQAKEEAQSRGQQLRWTVEGDYAPGRESVYLSWSPMFTQECRILAKDSKGRWQVDDSVFYELGLDVQPQEWLASIL